MCSWLKVRECDEGKVCKPQFGGKEWFVGFRMVEAATYGSRITAAGNCTAQYGQRSRGATRDIKDAEGRTFPEKQDVSDNCGSDGLFHLQFCHQTNQLHLELKLDF